MKAIKGYYQKQDAMKPDVSREMASIYSTLNDVRDVKDKMVEEFDKKIEQTDKLSEKVNLIVDRANENVDQSEQLVEKANASIEEVNQKVDNTVKKVVSFVEDTQLIVKDLTEKAAAVTENIKARSAGDEKTLIEKTLQHLPEYFAENIMPGIMSKIPNESALLKKFLSEVPKSKKELKVIQEMIETDPTSVIDKILALPEQERSKLKLKTSNIDGLDQTISAFRNQIATGKGYLHGGGDTVVAGTGITITPNPNGTKTISSTADLSVTLADVSANSTTTPLSTYTMTSAIPVTFKTSVGAQLLKMEETSGIVRVGSGTPTFSNTGSPGGIVAVMAATDYYYAPLSGQNISAGTTQSTDIILANDAGTDTTNYSDFGINSSNNADPLYTAMGAGVAYWYNQSGAMSLGTASSNSFNIFTGGTLAANIRMTVLGTGNVGIGITSPTAPLSIYASGAAAVGTLNIKQNSSPTGSSNVGAHISFGDTAIAQRGWIGFFDNATHGVGTQLNIKSGGQIGLTAGNVGTANQVTLATTGNLGVGTTAPQTFLDVRGTPNANYGILSVFDSRTMAINQGGVISLGGYKTSTSSEALFAKIKGLKENGTAGNEAGYLAFETNTSAAYSEAMRITSTGTVGIGQTVPTAQLTVKGSGTGYMNIGQYTPDPSYGGFSIGGLLSLTEYTMLAGHVGQSDQNDLYISRKSGGAIRIGEAGGTPQMYIATGGNIGIGTGNNTPLSKLQISKTPATAFGSPYVSIGRGDFVGTSDRLTIGYGYVTTGSVQPVEIGVQTTSGTGNTKADIVFAARDTTVGTDVPIERMRMTSAGLFGIGLTPTIKFQVADANIFTGTSVASSTFAAIANAGIYTTNAQGINVGAVLALGGMRDDAATSIAVFGAIKGAKENATTADNNGYLGFYTLQTGNTVAEKMRLSSLGYLGLGITTPAWQAQVHGASQNTSALTDAGVSTGEIMISSTNNTTNAGGVLSFAFLNDNATYVRGAAIKLLEKSGTSNGRGNLAFSLRSAVADTALTEKMILTYGGELGIGISVPRAGIHYVGNNSSTQMLLSDVETDATNKNVRIAATVYTTANLPACVFNYQNTSSNNYLSIGGGTSVNNSATIIGFCIGANNNTATGTEVMQINSTRITASLPVRLKGYTVAGLPAGTVGDTAYVTDQLTTPAAKGVAPTGGGAVNCVVFYNGTAWVGI